MKSLRSILSIAFVFIPLVGNATETLHYQGEETLFRDTVWQGEVLIDGILTVAPEVTLEIRPGTQVRFTRLDSNSDGIGEHELFIQGTLLAVGTENEPIRFTSAEADPLAGDWGAINMLDSEKNNRLQHCLVEFGYRGFHAHFAAARLSDSIFRHNVLGVQFQESTVTIERCRIGDNRNGLQFRDATVDLLDTVIDNNYLGLRCLYSKVLLQGCRIDGNLVNGANFRDSSLEAEHNRITRNRRGLYLQRSEATVRGNLIIDNSEHGILLEVTKGEVIGNRVAGNGRSGLRVVDSEVAISKNDLSGNGEYDLVNDGGTAVAARGNWWGTTEPDTIAERIRDRADRPAVGPVDSTSALTENPLSSENGPLP